MIYNVIMYMYMYRGTRVPALPALQLVRASDFEHDEHRCRAWPTPGSAGKGVFSGVPGGDFTPISSIESLLKGVRLVLSSTRVGPTRRILWRTR